MLAYALGVTQILAFLETNMLVTNMLVFPMGLSQHEVPRRVFSHRSFRIAGLRDIISYGGDNMGKSWAQRFVPPLRLDKTFLALPLKG